jgi:hypothetical protein
MSFLKQNKFSDIANNLINSYHLVTKNDNYQIIEIEFYYYSKDHNDPFVHKDVEQKCPKKFYFHKQNGKNYKGGTLS